MALEPLAPPPIDVDRLLGTLHARGVRYVLIGGYALNLLGVGLLTQDVDICYDARQGNVRALACALRDLEAVPVDADLRPLPGGVDPRALQFHDNVLFVTAAGRLDCLRVPDGTGGYDDLVRNALAYDVDGVPAVLPAVEDMIRMKKATNRPKDRAALEELGALDDLMHGLPPPGANPADPRPRRPGDD